MQSRQLKDLRRHRENEKRNLESLSKKLDRALSRYSKSEVVRVDIAYLQSCHRYRRYPNVLPRFRGIA